MAALGERLRREREARGISLEAISAQTRIGVRLLKAIEENALDQLPGGIFNKSFVRQYARFLGLDEEAAVREYLQGIGAGREEAVLPPEAEPAQEGLLATWGDYRLGLAAAVLAVIIAAVWYWLPRAAPPKEQPATATASQPSASSEPPATGEPALPSENTAGPARATVSASGQVKAPSEGGAAPAISPSSPAAALSPPSAARAQLFQAAEIAAAGEVAEELLLQINARSTVWLSITADGEQQWQGILEPNQSRAVQASDSIRLTVGNAGGVELTLNGKAMGSLGREGEVKTVTIAARAIQDSVP